MTNNIMAIIGWMVAVIFGAMAFCYTTNLYVLLALGYVVVLGGIVIFHDDHSANEEERS